MIIIVLPYVGNVLFFTFGLRYSNKRELEITKSDKYNLDNFSCCSPLSPYVNKNEILNSIQNITETRNFSGQFKIYSEGYHFYEKLFDTLRNAKKTINLVTYIIKPSEISEEFLEILEKKAQEGLIIRWLIDSFGMTFLAKEMLKKLKSYKNVEIDFIGKIHYP
ncbi:hypothetical protein MALL_0194, partial [Mycoplasmopsis alligatoris A21JP2]